MIDNVVITSQIGGYLLDFVDAGIQIKVTRLDVHKDGRVTGSLTARVHSAIFHRECNLGRKHQPMGFCMDFNDDNKSLSITRESVTTSEFIGKVTSQNAVVDALKSGLKSVKDIADDTGLKENNVRTSLGRLSSKVVKVGNQWGLKSHHVDEMPF